MRQQIKRLLSCLGFYDLWSSRTEFPGLLVLCYHAIRKDAQPGGAMPLEGLHVLQSEFHAHCKFFRGACHPVSLTDWSQIRRGRTPKPKRPVLVTFDDGYRSVLELGLPVLEEFKIPAVLFACTEPIRKQTLFWFDAVARRDGEQAVNLLKGISYAEWKKRVPLDDPVRSDDPCAPITEQDARRLAAHPLIEIGAHTANHPILAMAPPGDQTSEIQHSKLAVERWTGQPIRAFAFPNGRRHLDFDRSTLAILNELGFEYAFTTETGFSGTGEDPLQLSRFMMTASIDRAELAHRICFSWPR